MEVNEANNPPYLALDLGERYIGLAFSEAGFLAKELETIDRKNLTDEKVFEQIESIIKNYKVQTLAVGLPVNADGSENTQCAKIRQFIKMFQSTINNQQLDIGFFPENYSSFDAKEQLKQKIHKKDRFSPDHSVAARIILEHFLESKTTK